MDVWIVYVGKHKFKKKWAWFVFNKPWEVFATRSAVGSTKERARRLGVDIRQQLVDDGVGEYGEYMIRVQGPFVIDEIFKKEEG